MSVFANLSPNLLIVIASIFGLLVLAQLIVFTLKKTKPNLDIEELSLRVRSWWIMVIIFIGALVINPSLSVVFLALVSFLALKEYFSMIPTRRADRRVLFWAYLAIPLQFYFAAIGWYGMFIIFIPVYMFLLIPARMIIGGDTQHFLQSAGTLHWGLMTTVYCLSHASYLLGMSVDTYLPAGNAGLLLYLILLTQLNDVAQYCWGKLLGRRKIVPLISPQKTTVGFFGGIITTTVVALALATLLTPFSLFHAACLGVLISVAGFIGDVNISAVKRDMGVKDTGTLLPGHGGILDRVDSLTFTAPIYFHFLNYFYL